MRQAQICWVHSGPRLCGPHTVHGHRREDSQLPGSALFNLRTMGTGHCPEPAIKATQHSGQAIGWPPREAVQGYSQLR